MKTTLFAFLFLAATFFTVAQERIKTKPFDPAFVHVVYIWLKNPDSEADRTRFEASLNKFLDHSKFAKTNYIGIPPKATRGVVDDSFTYNLIVTFGSAEAQDRYQTEKAHLVFIEECKDLWNRVLVYDSKGLPNER
ncbi:MAG: Dabb family protein [Bacteroidota bacterium]